MASRRIAVRQSDALVSYLHHYLHRPPKRSHESTDHRHPMILATLEAGQLRLCHLKQWGHLHLGETGCLAQSA
jgi:hypothetical protein